MSEMSREQDAACKAGKTRCSEQASVAIQTSPEAVPAVPAWLGEVTVVAHDLQRLGLLAEISERARFARRRFGHYDFIDFAVVLLGYASSIDIMVTPQGTFRRDPVGLAQVFRGGTGSGGLARLFVQ
jgi:hypothetical protein